MRWFRSKAQKAAAKREQVRDEHASMTLMPTAEEVDGRLLIHSVSVRCRCRLQVTVADTLAAREWWEAHRADALETAR